MSNNLAKRMLSMLLVLTMLTGLFPAAVWADDGATSQQSDPASVSSEPVAPESEPTVPESEPTVPESEPTVPESEPTIPESEPTVPESEPTVPESEPTVPESEPTVPESEPTVPESEPTVPESEPTVPESEPAVSENEAAPKEDAAANGQNSTVGGFFNVITKKTYAVSEGATETHFLLNDDTATNQNKAYVMEVDMSNPNITVMPSYKDMDPTQNFGTQVLSQQAAAAERLGYNVVGGINTNLSWDTVKPFGMLVINGEVYCNDTTRGGSYLAVDKNNKAELRPGTQPLDGSEWQAVTANFGWLVKDGVNVAPTADHASGSRAPRTCIGIKADGTLVLFVVDGRQDPVSVGMSMNELGNMLLELGCVNAVNCDGGGSSTFLSKREGASLSVKNVPSDGTERATLCGLLVVSTAVRDGNFHHASITAANDFVTPGSEVQLTASGVDAGGGAADLPAEGLIWQLNDDTMGSIAQTGLFTSNGKAGQVTVQLLHNGVVCGEHTLTMMEPDTLFFFETSRSVGLGSSIELEMLMQSEGKTLAYKGSDFTWRMELLSSNDSAVTDPAAIGRIEQGTTKFVANDSKSGDIRVTAVYTRQDGSEVTASAVVAVGKQPYVFWDYEDGVQTVEVWEQVTDEVDANGAPVPPYWRIKRDADGSIVYEDKYFPAEEYFNALMVKNPGNVTVEEQMASHFGLRSDRGAKGHTEIATLDSGEPVRFGEKSLKLCYDFTGSTGAPSVLGYGFMQNTHNAPGSPTGIGMWIYVPEGTPGYTLKSIIQSNGRAVYVTYSYTYKNEQGETVTTSNLADMAGRGWIYVYQSLVGKGNGTFKMLRNYTIRMIAEGFTTHPERKAAGEIYIDNIEFVYGDNDKDTSNPIVTSVFDYNTQATNMEIEPDGSTVFNKNKISFAARFEDDKSGISTGIDPKTARVYVDGVNMSEREGVVITKDNMMVLPNVHLANGLHSVRFRVRDNYGNETNETRYFTVNGTEQCDTTMTMEPVQSAPVLGQDYSVALKAVNADEITGFDVTAKFSKNLGEPAVTFAAGFEGTYSYQANSGELTIKANRPVTALAAVDSLATVTFKVPTDLNEGAQTSFGVLNGTFTTRNDTGFTNSFSIPATTVDVAADYHIENTSSVIGRPFEIRVLDAQGKGVAGAVVTADGIEQPGVTDAEGKMTLQFSNAGKIVLGASTTDETNAVRYAWNKDVTVHTVLNAETKEPFYIQNNFISNDAKSFTWLSSITGAQDKAVLRIYTEDPAANTAATYQEYTGTTELVDYATESARINTVRVTGLPGSYYYRVGDGVTFSEVLHASSNGGAADFYILGDVQTTNVTNAQTIINKIANDGVPYDFSIQTGDFVDDSTRYAYWDALSKAFDAKSLNSVDMIHVVGNHELYGNEDGEITNKMWDLPAGTSGSYYSVERDGVYVAVINYSLTGRYEEAFDWLVKDAQASSARWKILTMHVPAYCTNPEAHNQYVYENLPVAAQKAGIDFVFAGHDHAYARTEPVRGGQVADNGIVYYICGAVGDKEYNIDANPEYHFAVTNGNYKAMYMTVHADEKALTVKAINLNGEVIDTYTREYVPCADGVHSYQIDTANGTIKCAECGDQPTGIMEVQGRLYYAMNGKLYSGWRSAFEGTDMYYFDPVTYEAVTGKITIDNKEYTFNDQGVLIRGAFVKEAGGTRYYFGPKALYQKWIKLEEGTYWADENGYLVHGYYAHQEYNHADYYWYHFDEQTGLLIGKCSGFVEKDGKTYYCDENGKVVYGAIQVEDGILFSATRGLVVKNADCYINETTVGITGLEYGPYYCNEQGRIVSDGFADIQSHTYYFTNYKRAKGFTQIGADYYIFNAGNGRMYRDANMWVNANPYGIETGMHYFAADGKMFIPDLVNGEKKVIEENGNLYFTIDGVKMSDGIHELNGEYYNANPNGILSRSAVVYVSYPNSLLPSGAGYYEFDAQGKLVKTGYVDNGTNMYRYDDMNRAKGFTKIGQDYYIFNEGDGRMYRDANMWVKANKYGIEPGMHYFAADGKMFVPDLVNGEKKIVTGNGNLYFTIDGVKMTDGIHELNGEYYNANPNGVLSRSAVLYVSYPNSLLPSGAGYYEFDAQGKLVKTGYVDNGTNLYRYDNMKRAKGFTKIGQDYYIFNEGDGRMYRNANMWVKANKYGIQPGMHYFAADGKMAQ